MSLLRTAKATTPCTAVRAQFSAYLDGAVTGVEMAVLSAHLDTCTGCSAEFALWRQIQSSLAAIGPAMPPPRLQSRLRAAVAIERERGTHLSPARQARRLWAATLAPIALRVSGGLTAALVMVASLGYVFGAPIQANDDRLAHMVAPRYLSSVVPPQPIATRHDTPIVVDAMIDAEGRVYDFTVLEAPKDSSTGSKVLVQVEGNLLNSTFAPATVFGVPVRGHVVLTYTGVSVRG